MARREQNVRTWLRMLDTRRPRLTGTPLRKWLILAPLSFGLLLVPLLGHLAPARYRFEAVIARPDLRDTPSSQPWPSPDAVLTASRLEQIATDLELGDTSRSTGAASTQDVVQLMRREIGIADSGPTGDRLRISYTSHDPELARRVTNRLAALYVAHAELERRRAAARGGVGATAAVPAGTVEPSQLRLAASASHSETLYRSDVRALLVTAGPAAGLLVGALLLTGVSRRVTGVARADDVQRTLQLPVLGVVPLMLSPHQRRLQDVKWRCLDLGGYGLLIVAAGVALLWGLGQ
jgi:hypothetical protein